VGSFFVLPLGLVVTHLSENLLIKKSIPQIMSLLPIIKQTKVNLVKGQIRARKNLQKIIAAGEGRAKKNLEKVLNRRQMTSKKNPEKPGNSGFI
jgi:energy-converting hydrogenase Eha subunit H